MKSNNAPASSSTDPGASPTGNTAPSVGGGNATAEGKSNELEQWLVGRIQKKGVASLSHEEISVIFAGIERFAKEWQTTTGEPMPDYIRKQITDRMSRKENKFDGTEVIPLFHRAVLQGDCVKVRSILQKHTGQLQTLLSATDNSKKTALHMAAKDGFTDILQTLADHKADLVARDRTGRTPLHIACEFGQGKSVAMLLKYGVPTEVADGLGRNPFHLACCSESIQTIDYMLGHKPKILNSSDKHQRTGLFYAILNTHKSGVGEQITQHLLNKHADVNFRDAYRKTPLHYACEENRKTCAMTLLRYRADPAMQDGINRITPLQACREDGALRREIRKFLGLPETSSDAAVVGGGGNGGTANLNASGKSNAPIGPKKGIEWEPLSERIEGISTRLDLDGEPVVAIGKAPIALGVTFAQTRDRFIKFMGRVQEGGLQQFEHIKQPHLFTGTWMNNVSSHQQLLGLTLAQVPGPEVAIRVYNLLRPPSYFPSARGDEKDILSYYQKTNTENTSDRFWDGGEDPFNLLTRNPNQQEEKEAEFSQHSRKDLVKELFILREQMESREAVVEELKKRNGELALKTETYMSPDQVRGYKDEISRLRNENTAMELSTQDIERKIARTEAENRTLRTDLDEQAALAVRLKTELAAALSRLDVEMERQGQEQAWKAVKERIDAQLDELEKDKGMLQARVAELQRKLEEKYDVAENAALRKHKQIADDALAQLKNIQLKLQLHQDKAMSLEAEVTHLKNDLESSQKKNALLESSNNELQAKYKNAMIKRAQEQYEEVAKCLGLQQQLDAEQQRTEQLQRKAEQSSAQANAALQQAELANKEFQAAQQKATQKRAAIEAQAKAAAEEQANAAALAQAQAVAQPVILRPSAAEAQPPVVPAEEGARMSAAEARPSLTEDRMSVGMKGGGSEDLAEGQHGAMGLLNASSADLSATIDDDDSERETVPAPCIPLELGYRGKLKITINQATCPDNISPYVICKVHRSMDETEILQCVRVDNSSEPVFTTDNQKEFNVNISDGSFEKEDYQIEFSLWSSEWGRDTHVADAFFPLPRQKNPVTQTVITELKTPKEGKELLNAHRQPSWLSFTYTWIEHKTPPPNHIEIPLALDTWMSPGLKATEPYGGLLSVRLISAHDLPIAENFNAQGVLILTEGMQTNEKSIAQGSTFELEFVKSQRIQNIEGKASPHVVFNEVLEYNINWPFRPGGALPNGTGVGPDSFTLHITKDGGLDSSLGACQVPYPLEMNSRELMVLKLGGGDDQSRVFLEVALLSGDLTLDHVAVPSQIKFNSPHLKMPMCGHLNVKFCAASGVRAADPKIGAGWLTISEGRSDPYAVARVLGSQKWNPKQADSDKLSQKRSGRQKSSIQSGTLDPVWNETVHFDIANCTTSEDAIKNFAGKKGAESAFCIELFDEDTGGMDDHIGEVDLGMIYDDFAKIITAEGDSPGEKASAIATMPVPQPKRWLVKLPLKNRATDKDKNATGMLQLDVSFVPLFDRYYFDATDYNVCTDLINDEIEAQRDGAWFQAPPPQQDNSGFHLTGVMQVKVICASNIRNADGKVGNLSDPYVTVKVPVCPSGKEAKVPPLQRSEAHVKIQEESTHTLDDTLYPVWMIPDDDHRKGDWEFIYSINWPASEWPGNDLQLPALREKVKWVDVDVYDKDLIGKDYLGGCRLPMPGQNVMFPVGGFNQKVLAALSDPYSKDPKHKMTGEILLEYNFTPIGGSKMATQRPIALAPDSIPSELTRPDLGMGELKIWVRSATNLESFKKMFGGSVCHPFVHVIVPRSPLVTLGKKKFEDQGRIWRIPASKQSTTHPSWDAHKSFTINHPSRATLEPVVVEVWSETGMMKSHTFLGEITFPIPDRYTPQCAVADSTLRCNKEKRKESGKHGQISVEYEWIPLTHTMVLPSGAGRISPSMKMRQRLSSPMKD